VHIQEQTSNRLVLKQQSLANCLFGVTGAVIFSLVFVSLVYSIIESPLSSALSCQRTQNQIACELTESFPLQRAVRREYFTNLQAAKYSPRHNLVLIASGHLIAFPSSSFFLHSSNQEVAGFNAQIQSFTHDVKQQTLQLKQSQRPSCWEALFVLIVGLMAVQSMHVAASSTVNLYIFDLYSSIFTVTQKPLFGSGHVCEYPLVKISALQVKELRSFNGGYMVILELGEITGSQRYDLGYFYDQQQAKDLSDRIRSFLELQK
jgi:hypothetical protein